MKNAFRKDILRSITSSWGRFIAILIIVALGAGFYAGLRMTAPDMRISADAYYDGTHLYDLRLISTLGFSEDMLEELANIEGVEQTSSAKEADVLGIVNTTQLAVRVHSLDGEAAAASDTTDGVNALSSDESYLNRPILASGSWPREQGECVLSAETMASVELSIGDTIEFSEGVTDPDEVFETTSYTVVGFVRSPYYSSSASLGVTSIGSGTIEQYMYVPQSDFKESYPSTNIFLTVKGACELAGMSNEYFELVDQTTERIKDEVPGLEAMRLSEIKDEVQAELDEKRSEFEQEKADALAGLDAAAAELDAAKQQIDEGTALLMLSGMNEAAATVQMSEARASYEASRAEYETARADAEDAFASAEEELAAAQEEIDEIAAPDIFVLDRSKNYGAKSFDSDAGRVNQIAMVFPLMFFLVAALVSLTTMTRMVEEERTLIGTYKALGYSRQRIALKYVVYAFAASVIGAIIGILTLTKLLPTVIMNAYRIMYDVPTGNTAIDPGIAAISLALGIGVTCFAAWGAALSTLREKPSSLMLPRAPKPGKRIFLERIPALWRRLSFSWKVTCRNLFRYKKRLAMTLIGIAGCTALLLTGFGLSNAINDIIPRQFGEIYGYNMTVMLTEDEEVDDEEKVEQSTSEGTARESADELDGDSTTSDSDTVDDTRVKDEQKIEEILSDSSLVYTSTRAHTENVTAVSTQGGNVVAMLQVPEDPEEFKKFHLMRDRLSHEEFSLGDNSVILSEKLAHSLGLDVGDSITFARQDAAGYAKDERYEFTVDAVMENYVSHYIIMSPTLFAKVVGEEPDFLTIFAHATTDASEREYMSDTLLALESVRTVGYNDEIIESYETALASVDSIVVVIIIAAAALAFVVLYNLTNINITERQREIATLKVLGFTKRETANYVFREMILLTILGAAFGLILGIFMEGFVVTTAEVDAVMFGRQIHASSFVIAFVMTVLFAFVVAFFMRSKLARIDMVESLKSVE